MDFSLKNFQTELKASVFLKVHNMENIEINLKKQGADSAKMLGILKNIVESFIFFLDGQNTSLFVGRYIQLACVDFLILSHETGFILSA